jgi:hypothetical protein
LGPYRTTLWLTVPGSLPTDPTVNPWPRSRSATVPASPFVPVALRMSRETADGGTVGNEPGTVNQSVVRYGPNAVAQAHTVAAAVPGSVLQPSDSIGDTVQLVIGPGYSTVVPVQVSAPPADGAVPTTAAPSSTPAPVSC